MGYCVNSSGALVPFASDKAACDAVGGSFTAEINTSPSLAGVTEGFDTASKRIAGYGTGEGWNPFKGEFPPIGPALNVINPAPEVMELINNLSDPDVRNATIEFVKQNPLKATAATVIGYITKKMKKVGSATRLAGVSNAANKALGDEDLNIMSNAQQYLIDPAKEEIERGVLNIHGGEPAVENKKDEDEKPPLTEEEQKKLDEQAADDLAKNRTSTETARKSFSDRFKAGMKDPATINKLGMLMDYYGRNLQDRGENPLVAYEAAKARQAAANKPDTAAFNAVDMSDTVLTDLFTPNKGWFFGKSEEERKKLAAAKIGRYRTIQNAAFTRHGVILTHGEIMKLLEKERDEALAAAKRAKAAK